jgi:hypothetical protein
MKPHMALKQPPPGEEEDHITSDLFLEFHGKERAVCCRLVDTHIPERGRNQWPLFAPCGVLVGAETLVLGVPCSRVRLGDRFGLMIGLRIDTGTRGPDHFQLCTLLRVDSGR